MGGIYFCVLGRQQDYTLSIKKSFTDPNHCGLTAGPSRLTTGGDVYILVSMNHEGHLVLTGGTCSYLALRASKRNQTVCSTARGPDLLLISHTFTTLSYLMTI